MNRLAFLMFLNLLTSSYGQFLPYENGPYNTVHLNIVNNETLDLPYNLDIWSPQQNGSFPFLFFLSGFGAFIPGEGYGQVLSHIASHGFVVVAGWLIIGNPFIQSLKIPLVEDTISWCHTNLENFLYDNGVPSGFTINYNLSFAMAHSAGCHVFVDYLQIHCDDFKGLILASPVDGIGPFGIAPSETLNFTIPTFLLQSGLDNAPSTENTSFSCAPDELSNIHFWEALHPSSHRWYLNATEFGHVDFLDNFFVEANRELHFCAYNEENILHDYNTYRKFIGGQVTSFMKGILEKDCTQYTDIIEDTSHMPVNAISTNFKPTACPTPYCEPKP